MAAAGLLPTGLPQGPSESAINAHPVRIIAPPPKKSPPHVGPLLVFLGLFDLVAFVQICWKFCALVFGIIKRRFMIGRLINNL